MSRNQSTHNSIDVQAIPAPSREEAAISISTQIATRGGNFLRRLFSNKSANTRGLRLASWTCLLLLGAGSVMSHARQAAGEREALQAPLMAGQIACVDMDRLYAASGGPEQLAQRASEITQEVNAHLKDMKAVPLLDENELQEYGTLVFKTTKTEAEQARAKALRTLSDQRQDELNKLQIKPDGALTAEDKARMKQLQEQSRLLASIMPYWQDDARAQQSDRLEAYRRTQLAKLRQVVGKAAAERNIAHVFDTSALVYSANDITSVVVARVSKRAPKDVKEKDVKE